MTALSCVPDEVAQIGDNFFRPFDPGSYLEFPHLLPGQTEWIGRYPNEGEFERSQRWDLQTLVRCAAEAKREGVHLHVKSVGRLNRVRRLNGPARKLSDWKELPAGTPMLLNPHSTADDVESAESRIRYMRHRDLGRFRAWLDDAAWLWVERL